MRLTEFQVRQVCQKIFTTLRAKQLIVLKKSEPEIMERMISVFLGDLKAEDEINTQAEQLLEEHIRKTGINVDRQRMFQMIKKQLAKDKNIII